MSMKEARKRGWNELDVILISSDAYVDHPSFAAGIIGRYIESFKMRVGIIAQPDWHNIEDFKKLGRPKYFFGVTAGNLDSMVSLYTAQRKIRREDKYSEGGLNNQRPYLPGIVYTNRLKQAFKNVPVIIGGIEASLRRIAHYDYYQDKIRPSILLDAKADLLVYGNGEKPLKEIIPRLKKGESIKSFNNIRGTAIPVSKADKNNIKNVIRVTSFEQVKEDKDKFLKMTRVYLENMNPYNAKAIYQDTGTRGVLINPPSYPLSSPEIDEIYNLPYSYTAHPSYKKEIPALKVVETSITSHRGCYGGCNFCSIYMHQGKFIQSRSLKSMQDEINILSKKKRKELTLQDVGGPTANMYGTYCKYVKSRNKCKSKSCLYPVICRNLSTSMKSYSFILNEIRQSRAVEKVFINTGIRTDLALKDRRFITQIVRYHTSGRLSTAPEHCDPEVLKIMGKPSISQYNEFARLFIEENKKVNKKQFLSPYFIVGHPGADDRTEEQLSNYIKSNHYSPEQIQEFYPTPMTVSTAIYYSGKDLYSNREIKVQKKTGIKKQWKKNVGINIRTSGRKYDKSR